MNYIFMIIIFCLCLLFAFEMRRSMKRSNVTAKLAEKYFDDQENPQLIDEIYDYCQNDFKLKKILLKHNADRDTIAHIYEKLRVWGNIKKGRRYVPVVSFFYAYALEWLLTHKDEDEKKMAMKMMNIFHI